MGWFSKATPSVRSCAIVFTSANEVPWADVNVAGWWLARKVFAEANLTASQSGGQEGPEVLEAEVGGACSAARSD